MFPPRPPRPRPPQCMIEISHLTDVSYLALGSGKKNCTVGLKGVARLHLLRVFKFNPPPPPSSGVPPDPGPTGVAFAIHNMHMVGFLEIVATSKGNGEEKAQQQNLELGPIQKSQRYYRKLY